MSSILLKTSNVHSKPLHNGGIGSNGDLRKGSSFYLCFTVTQRTNKLMFHTVKKHSKHQQENYDLIKSLQKEGLGYRKISKLLNERGIKTSKGNTWTNTKVFSVLKRYKEREERLELINREYEPVWGRMKVIKIY